MPFSRFQNEEYDGYTPEVQVTQLTNVRRKYRLIRFIVALVVLLLAVGIAVGVYFATRKKDEIPQFKEMEGDMDKDINPCNDFYKYACGKYIDRYMPYGPYIGTVYMDKFASLQQKNTLKLKSLMDSMSKTSDPFFKKAHSYYQSCMTSKRDLNVFWNAAKAVGGSSMTNYKGTFDSTNWSLENALAQMKLLYNTNPLFTVEVGANLFNSTQNIIIIKPPDIALITKVASEDEMMRPSPKSNEYVLEDDLANFVAEAKSFQSHVKYYFSVAAREKTGQYSFEIYNAIDQATAFQTTLIEDLVSTMKGIAVHKMYKTISVSNLTSITGGKLKWLTLLQKMLPSQTITNKTIVGLMVTTSYLKKIKSYLTYYIYKRKLANFFVWSLLKKLSPALPDEYFAAYYFKTGKYSIGSKGKERWRACILDTEANLPMSVGMMFAKNAVSKKHVDKALEMLKEVETAFEIGSGKLAWLDNQTKLAVKEKIKDVINVISGPDNFPKDFLNKMYKNAVVTGSNIAQSFVSCQRNIVQMNLKQITEAPSRKSWNLAPTRNSLFTVNAFYDRTKNKITVLSGILREPFVYSNGPTYINFGKIGSIVGHELSHGFDSLGWYFDKDGNIAPWWTNASATAFTAKANCVKRQYGNYYSGSDYVDGAKTLAENIADNAGLKYSYEAYKNWAKRNGKEKKPQKLKDLSYDQLFFLGYAQMWCRAASNSIKDALRKSDTHSPNRYRVIGSVSNFEPFARAYNCKKGSLMNPVNRCEFW